jgi:hypothetical protein
MEMTVDISFIIHKQKEEKGNTLGMCWAVKVQVFSERHYKCDSYSNQGNTWTIMA